jgi:hypothetical protein
MLLFLGSKMIIKYVAMRTPIFGDEYCQNTSTDAFRRDTNSADGKVSQYIDAPMMEPNNHCGDPMSKDCQTCASAQARVRRSISLEHLHNDNRFGLQM